MKIFTVEFAPIWPVGCHLIIAANNEDEAKEFATKTITHTDEFSIKEIDISKPCVVSFDSGEY